LTLEEKNGDHIFRKDKQKEDAASSEKPPVSILCDSTQQKPRFLAAF
jgi:hypothetical protein